MDIKNYAFIMRGIPGSGKSTLAKEFAEVFNATICSADDFHMKNGVYAWKPENVGMAHGHCKNLFVNCLMSGLNVIVDNTNVKPSEYNFYIDQAARAGYKVYFVEPTTAWAYNVNECNVRNTHGVPLNTLERMLDSLLHTKTLKSDIPVINSVEEVE